MLSSFPTVATRRRRLLVVAGLVASSLTVIAPAVPSAHADTNPAKGTPATVSTDALPTVQQNGVVWSQTVVGNTVYATGSFSQIYPAGQAPTAGNTFARGNIIAYSLSSGHSDFNFVHNLNAQGLVVAASPDGSRVYVGGDFTQVDGQARNHIAAFDTKTGKLISTFHPSFSGTVRAIVATDTTVYVGGNFFNVGGVPRTRLAKLSAIGALYNWAPTADDNTVTALTFSPDYRRLIVGGRFTTLNQTAALGMGSVSTGDGASLPWQANTVIRDGGTQCGITSLASDSKYVYGSGFANGCGNFEGAFAADPATGNVVWANDCHGDTYGVLPLGSVLYSVSHAHDCSALHQFPDTTSPRVAHHGLAWTTAPSTGTNVGPDSYGWNFAGVHYSRLLHWFPTMANGTVTGQNQAAWAITGNANYIALGGEFPTVNGVRQAGLVRYAIAQLAPNKRGPVITGGLTPSARRSGSSVSLTWRTTWDPDNTDIRYRVYRDGLSTPSCNLVVGTPFWSLPTIGCTVHGLSAGTHSFVVKANDHFGNTLTSGTVRA